MQYLNKFFIHEYSSFLLIWNYDLFPEDEWNKINPIGSEYSKVDFFNFNEELPRENGFLINYSMSERENDFNIIAQHLFEGEPKFLDSEFWPIAEEYPKIKQKVDIVIDFYQKIDPVFTEE